ncbi:hypothetical protein Syun_029978 [Stephania yunnanensis]|uniref:Uncharacterized protein n=1 Tax=Stephania yunnanensis TaxID=152371 RepID=A0AAP0HHS4_9MAGN
MGQAALWMDAQGSAVVLAKAFIWLRTSIGISFNNNNNNNIASVPNIGISFDYVYLWLTI